MAKLPKRCDEAVQVASDMIEESCGAGLGARLQLVSALTDGFSAKLLSTMKGAFKRAAESLDLTEEDYADAIAEDLLNAGEDGMDNGHTLAVAVAEQLGWEPEDEYLAWVVPITSNLDTIENMLLLRAQHLFYEWLDKEYELEIPHDVLMDISVI